MAGKPTHGQSYSSEYRIWHNMRTRCRNPKSPNFHRYGGRGISVCARWNRFANFFEDMGPRPSSEHSLDRYPNNDGNYEPGNCRWATRDEQNRNKLGNRYVEFCGRRMIVSDWARELGIGPVCLSDRLNRGWSVEKAFTKPVQIRTR